MNEMTMQPYIVYVLPDERNRVTAINSSAFLPDTSGWVEIDQGFGDKYHHAQGNYFDKPLMDERGVYRYKLVPADTVDAADGEPEDTIAAVTESDEEAVQTEPGQTEQEEPVQEAQPEKPAYTWAVVEHTQEEMDADYVPPVPKPDLSQWVAEMEESNRQLQEALDLLLSGEVE